MPASFAAFTSSVRSEPQLPVSTVSAPEALILATYGAKSRTCAQRVQIVADHLDVGPLARQHLLGRSLRHLLAVRVVLIDEVDLLDGLAGPSMQVVSASIFIEVSASSRKCQ